MCSLINSVHRTKEKSSGVPLNVSFLSVTVNFEQRGKKEHCECTLRRHISKNSCIQTFFHSNYCLCPLYCGKLQKKPNCSIGAGVSHQFSKNSVIVLPNAVTASGKTGTSTLV